MKQSNQQVTNCSLKQVAKPFFISRILILFAIFAGASFQTTLEPKVPVNKYGISILHPHLSFQNLKENLQNSEKIFLAGDSGWYHGIAEHGYHQEEFTANSQKNWAFFPLFPLIAKSLKNITGEYLVSVLIFNNLLFLLSLSLLYKLAREFKLSEFQALLSCYLLSFHPASYFFTLAFSESLFLFLLLLSFYLVKKNKFILSGLCYALLTAARPTGLIILPAYFLALFLENRAQNKFYKPKVSNKVLALLIAPLGALAFSLYLFLLTGEPLAWLKIQSTWRPGNIQILSELVAPFKEGVIMTDWNFLYLNALCLIIALFYSLKLLVKKHYSYALLSSLPLLAGIFTGSFISIARFSLMVFPVYFCLSQSLSKSQEKTFVFLCLSFSILIILSLLYGASVTGAMT